jgi:D-alanine--poly(phosphoribitol) ligase subunit 2
LQPPSCAVETGITTRQKLIRDIQAFLEGKLCIHVGSPETDLLDTGMLDSVAQVNLILYIEEHFRLHLPVENLEIDSFRSVASIAELIVSQSRTRLDPAGMIETEGNSKAKEEQPYSEHCEVNVRANLIREIQALFQQTWSLQVEAETNLFETGVLDSMTLVQFILDLEERFDLRLPMEDVEVESFGSVTKIAELVAIRTTGKPKFSEWQESHYGDL